MNLKTTKNGYQMTPKLWKKYKWPKYELSKKKEKKDPQKKKNVANDVKKNNAPKMKMLNGQIFYQSGCSSWVF